MAKVAEDAATITKGWMPYILSEHLNIDREARILKVQNGEKATNTSAQARGCWS